MRRNGTKKSKKKVRLSKKFPYVDFVFFSGTVWGSWDDLFDDFIDSWVYRKQLSERYSRNTDKTAQLYAFYYSNGLDALL